MGHKIFIVKHKYKNESGSFEDEVGRMLTSCYNQNSVDVVEAEPLQDGGDERQVKNSFTFQALPARRQHHEQVRHLQNHLRPF